MFFFSKTHEIFLSHYVIPMTFEWHLQFSKHWATHPVRDRYERFAEQRGWQFEADKCRTERGGTVVFWQRLGNETVNHWCFQGKWSSYSVLHVLWFDRVQKQPCDIVNHQMGQKRCDIVMYLESILGFPARHGGTPKTLDGLCQAKSEPKEWMMTGGTPMT